MPRCDQASWRRTFHGLARAIIASARSGATGTITVTANASGALPLTPGRVRLEAVAQAADAA
jgi:hypothetical protein